MQGNNGKNSQQINQEIIKIGNINKNSEDLISSKIIIEENKDDIENNL